MLPCFSTQKTQKKHGNWTPTLFQKKRYIFFKICVFFHLLIQVFGGWSFFFTEKISTSDGTVWTDGSSRSLKDGKSERWWLGAVWNNTPWKINGWKLQITHLERKMIFQTSMIMSHINLQGCIPQNHFEFSPPIFEVKNSKKDLKPPTGYTQLKGFGLDWRLHFLVVSYSCRRWRFCVTKDDPLKAQSFQQSSRGGAIT